MRKRTIIGLSLFFVLIFSTVIIATPPAGNHPAGTHYCENSATSGEQEYVSDGGGKWSGPYKCPGGCSKLGMGGSCKAPKSCDGGDGDETMIISSELDSCLIW